jgi:hypothetical protein
VYLLQFVQRGNWDSRFFTIDDIVLEGTGAPAARPTPAATPAATAAPVATPAADVPEDAIPVNIDFLRLQGRIRPSANLSIGAAFPTATGSVPFPLEENADFRVYLQTLNPRFIRLDVGSLVDLVDSSRPAFDFTRLQAAVRRVRSLKAEPLIAITAPAVWGLDARGFSVLATQAARVANSGGVQSRYFEVNTTGGSAATALALYRAAYIALKAQSKTYRVGGIGTTGGDTGTLQALLRSAPGIDFLALKYFGAYNGQPEADNLFATARDLAPLRSAAALLDRSKFRNAPIFITQANLNAANADGVPTDTRLTQINAAAWWATFLGEGSRLSDQIFFNDATNPQWGLLNENASAYPAYYALWMWNTFFPYGSQRVQATSENRDVAVFACNTPTAHNVLLTNTTGQELTARLTIRGFPVLRAARMRSLQDPLDPKTGVRFQDLPKSPFQTIKMAPYSVAVLQFIEPPKGER